MQQIQMHGELGSGDGARHREAILEQRPVECLSIEGDEHGSFRQALREFVQDGMFLAEVAHQQLLDLQPAGVPPSQAD